VTPGGRSVFYDLFPAEKAAELEMRAQLLWGLERWLENSRMTQAEAAKVLGVTPSARVGFETGQNQPIQHGFVGAVGSARWAQTQTENRGVSGQFLASENVQRRPPFGGVSIGGIGDFRNFYSSLNQSVTLKVRWVHGPSIRPSARIDNVAS
jgi:hypothetical protein